MRKPSSMYAPVCDFHSSLEAGLMMLEYYRSSTFDDYRYRDGVKEQVCEIINNAAWLIKDELKALLEQCMSFQFFAIFYSFSKVNEYSVSNKPDFSKNSS